MAQQPAVNAQYYAEPPPNYVEGSKPIYPSAPQQQQYPQYAPAPSQPAVIVQQPQMTTVIVGSVFGPGPVNIQCPSCQQNIVTVLHYHVGGLVWLICGLMTLFGCLLFAWIPCVIDSCKDVTHHCPNCKTVVGTYKRL